MSLEYGNNFENQTPAVKTGVSETPKDYQNLTTDVKRKVELSLKIEETFGLNDKDTEDIINTITKKFGNDNLSINELLNNFPIGIEKKDDIIQYINKQEVQSNVQEVQSNVQEVQSNVQEVQSNVQEVQSNVQEVQSNNQEKIERNKPLFAKLEQILSGVELEGKNGKGIKEMLKKGEFDNVINTLKNKDSFYEVATELRKKDPEKYREFEKTLLQINPIFREYFDEIGYEKKGTQKILDLGTPKISPDGKSGETIDGKYNIKLDDKGDRYLSSKNNPYKLKSNLDNQQNLEINQKIDSDLEKTLNPINEKLNTLSSILDYLENAISKNIDLKDIKESIKNTNILLYNELNIENLNSPSDIKNIITQSIKKLEDDKKIAIEKAKNLKKELISKNTKEAIEKDKIIKDLLKFLESIGFTQINQDKLQTIISFININPQKYGLQEKIDLENGILGFNKDFGDKNINPAEKQSFIKLFNNMLGENIIDENIALEKTSLNQQSIMKIQVLSNKTTGFFMENLGKMEEIK